jgi:hypothetical protein
MKMAATKIELRDYLETFRGIVPDDLICTPPGW